MLHAVPFRAEHALRLKVQPSQMWSVPYLTDEVLRALQGQHSYTYMDGSTPIACLGASRIWEDRAFLWTMIGADIGPQRFLIATRAGRAYLDQLPYRRVEAAVEVDFEEGHRWARILGFECEAARMRAFQIDGKDCALYARVKAA